MRVKSVGLVRYVVSFVQLQIQHPLNILTIKSFSFSRFIGELYKLNMLTLNIMHGCVKQLISKIDEESLECLCKLLMTIGKDLEKQSETCKNVSIAPLSLYKTI
jgi:hypothetical protein